MSPLEQLSPFVSLLQACGVIPYTIKYDLTTKKLIGFSFSFKCLTTWWFILNLILQSIYHFIFYNTSEQYLKLLSREPDAPITITILGAVTVAGYISQVAVSRWIVLFRYRRMKRVLEAMQKLERLIYNNEDDNIRNSIVKHFVVGFSISIFSVSVQPSKIYMFNNLFSSYLYSSVN